MCSPPSPRYFPPHLLSIRSRRIQVNDASLVAKKKLRKHQPSYRSMSRSLEIFHIIYFYFFHARTSFVGVQLWEGVEEQAKGLFAQLGGALTRRICRRRKDEVDKLSLLLSLSPLLLLLLWHALKSRSKVMLHSGMGTTTKLCKHSSRCKSNSSRCHMEWEWSSFIRVLQCCYVECWCF